MPDTATTFNGLLYVVRSLVVREFDGRLTTVKPSLEFPGQLTVETTKAFTGQLVVAAEPIPQVATVHVFVDNEIVVSDDDNLYGYSYGYCPLDPPIDTGIEPYGSDPFFFHSGCTLPPLDDGLHRIRIEVTSTTGVVYVEESTFLVDTEPPVIEITSPVDDVVNYTIDPVLEYTINDATSGVGFVDVIIDGISMGTISSGSVLTGLKDGLHTLEIHAYDLAKDEMGQGNKATATIQFLTATDFSINTSGVDRSGLPSHSTGQNVGFGSYAYIGADGTGEYQADGIIEEMRILDQVSSDSDILNDHRLLLSEQRFQNNKDGVVISAADQAELEQQGIDISRLNKPDNTLALFRFDNSVHSEERVGEKVQTSNVIISTSASNNDVDVLVRYPAGEVIDREMTIELLNKISSIHTQIFVTFEEVD